MSDFPYPGLRPFERYETDIFFGREEHTDQLIDLLGEKHFIAVLGRPGCGKSSLVRTGLLASLETGLLGSAGVYWRIAEFRPDNHPFKNLAEALLMETVLREEYLLHFPARIDQAVDSLEVHLRHGAQAVQELLKAVVLPEHTNLLILIDQFEELFRRTQSINHSELEAFIALLLESYKHPCVYVVITMRSDYVDDCARFFDLPEAITQGLFLTPRLSSEQLREVIAMPARVFGDMADEKLVKYLLNEMDENPDQLPLLQHALAMMWRYARAEKPGEVILTIDHYHRTGELTEGLSKHAEEVYDKELDPAQREIAEMLFRRLTERSEDLRYMRCPVTIEEAAKLTGRPWQQVVGVVEVFRKKMHSFLTPKYDVELMPDSMLDISHEALIRHWKRLRGWADKEARSAEAYRQLKTGAQQWREAKEEYEALLAGLVLANTLDWFDREHPAVEWAKRYDKDDGQLFALAMEFLEKSKEKKRKEDQKIEAARQQELEQEREKAELAKKAQQQAHQKFAWAIGAMLAVLVSIWIYWERNLAVEAHQLAEEAKRSHTLSLFNSQLVQAKLWIRDENYIAAKEALSETRQLSSDVPSSYRHSRKLLGWFSKAMGGGPQHIYKAKNTGAELYATAISPDARLLAAAGQNGTLTVFNMDDKEPPWRLQKGHSKDVRAVAFHPRDNWLASGGEDKRIILWSLPTDENKSIRQKGEWQSAGSIWTMAISPDGKYLASGGEDKDITLWDAATGQQFNTFKGHEGGISSLAFNPAGDILASASNDNSVRLWKAETGKSLQELRKSAEGVEHVIFSPDGVRLAAGSRNGSISVWNVASGQLQHVLEGPTGTKIFAACFIKNGQYLASGGADNKLRLWDVESGVVMRVLQGHKAGVTAISGHGQKLFSASRDGTVMRWNTDLPYRQADLPGEPASTAIAPDGNSVAVGFANGALRLYSLPNMTLLKEEEKAHARDVQRLVFSPDGFLLASAGLDSKAKLWQMKPEELLREQKLIQHKNDVSAVAFSSDGHTLATAGYDGQIGLFTIGSKDPVFFEKAHEGNEINSVAFAGTQLLSSDDNGVRLWNVVNGSLHPLNTFPGTQEGGVWGAISPDGKRFATVGTKPVVNVYSLPDGKTQYRLGGHSDTILRAEFSPDGLQLATISGDAAIRFWDLNNGTELFTLRLPALPNPPAPLWDFDFRCTPKGCRAAVPLTRGKLVLYDLGRIYE